MIIIPKPPAEMDEMPAPGEYWERPKRQKTGDPDRNLIYRAVGEATSQWEGIEDGLSVMFCLFVSPGNSRAARRAYGTISNAIGRKDAVRAASEIFFSEKKISITDQERCANLLNHYQHASARRNDIAHGIVLGFQENNHFLVPSLYNSKKIAAFPKPTADGASLGSRMDYMYTSVDIENFVAKFRVLSYVVVYYRDYLMKTLHMDSI